MSNEVIQQVDVLGTIRNIGKKNKRLQAAILSEIEKATNTDGYDFQSLRKFILDETNGYTRDIVNDVFGDIEYLLR